MPINHPEQPVTGENERDRLEGELAADCHAIATLGEREDRTGLRERIYGALATLMALDMLDSTAAPVAA